MGARGRSLQTMLKDWSRNEGLHEDNAGSPAASTEDVQQELRRSRRFTDRVTFHLPKGRSPGLSATTVLAKSTLIKIISGVLTPDTGSI